MRLKALANRGSWIRSWFVAEFSVERRTLGRADAQLWSPLTSKQEIGYQAPVGQFTTPTSHSIIYAPLWNSDAAPISTMTGHGRQLDMNGQEHLLIVI